MRHQWFACCSSALLIACGSPASSIDDASAATAVVAPAPPPEPPPISEPAIPFRFVLGASEESPHCRVRSSEGGYALETLDAAGAVRWRVEVGIGRGDLEAQCALDARGIVVWVRAGAGDFVDLLDADAGRVIGRTRFESNLTRVPFDPPEDAVRTRPGWRGQWPGRQGGEWRGIESNEGGLETAIAIVRAQHDATEETFWTFRDGYGCTSLALIETESTLFAAQHCGTSSGLWLHALSLEGEPTERERWVVRPSGIADAGQWTASNEVAMAIVDRTVRVWGQEGATRYVSTIDAETGRELAILIEQHR